MMHDEGRMSESEARAHGQVLADDLNGEFGFREKEVKKTWGRLVCRLVMFAQTFIMDRRV